MTGPIDLPGHVKQKDLVEVLKQKLASTSNAPADSPQAFLERAMEWVETWAGLYSPQDLERVGPFAIVYGPHWDFAADPAWSESEFFREDPDLDLGGQVALTTSPMDCVLVTNTGARRLKDLGQQIRELGLQGRPCLIVNAGKNAIYVCTAGHSGPRVEVPLDAEPSTRVTEEAINAKLDEFHVQVTRYPDGVGHVWHNRSTRVLKRDSEAIIRDWLFVLFGGLQKRTKSLLVVREYQSTVGRPDLCFYELRDATALIKCVMELKVVRSRGMTKSTKEKPYKQEVMDRHALMGVKQATKYKSAERAPIGYVCLYDGRDVNAEMASIKLAADQAGIVYRRFFMETSTRDDLGETT